MRPLTFRLVLCVLLVVHATAAPITYQQVAGQGGQKPQPPTSGSKVGGEQTPQSKIPESGDRPEFVRLADGRIVPYGAGIICTDDCVESEAFGPDDPSELRGSLPRLTPWLWGIPVAGGILAFVLLLPGDRTAVLSSGEPPIIVPPPAPAEIPEPATLMLLGLGLAMMARHGLSRKKSVDK